MQRRGARESTRMREREGESTKRRGEEKRGREKGRQLTMSFCSGGSAAVNFSPAVRVRSGAPYGTAPVSTHEFLPPRARLSRRVGGSGFLADGGNVTLPRGGGGS